MSTLHTPSLPLGDESFLMPIAPREPLRMSEEEFETWCLTVDEDVRPEWVDGEVQFMSPVNWEHVDLVGWLFRVMAEYVERKGLGIVKGPEFPIRLGNVKRRRVPDLFYLAKEHMDRKRRNYIEGPPDLVVEVVSPESGARDWRDKYHEYAAGGITEYWIVDPQSQRVDFYVLGKQGSYELVPEQDGKLIATTIPGLYLRREWLWDENRPTPNAAVDEMG